MMHITVSLPDETAQQYYRASERLADQLKDTGSQAPDAKTLMRFMLCGFAEEDIARHFDRALRNITGAPMPNEADLYVFSPDFAAAI
jgi:hypothetical protein